MDIKEIAKKLVAGENVSELIKGFDDAKTIEFNLAVKAASKEASDAELTKLSGLRQERKRIEDDTEGAATKIKDQAVAETTSKWRGEQLIKARSRFMSERGIKEEDMKTVDEAFKTEDSGAFDADLIISDLRRSYAKVNAEKLMDAEKNAVDNARNADNFNAGGASGGNVGGGTGDNSKQYSPEVQRMVAEARKRGIALSPEQAERGMKGGKRVFTAEKK